MDNRTGGVFIGSNSDDNVIFEDCRFNVQIEASVVDVFYRVIRVQVIGNSDKAEIGLATNFETREEVVTLTLPAVEAELYKLNQTVDATYQVRN